MKKNTVHSPISPSPPLSLTSVVVWMPWNWNINWTVHAVQLHLTLQVYTSTTGYTRKSGIIILLYFVLTSPHSGEEKKKKNTRSIGTVLGLYSDTGDQCSQLIVATLVPSTPICLFFNLAKLQCKQTVVTDFCIGFVNKIHISGTGVIKETWIAKIKEIRCWIKELITFCPFSPISAWSKKLPNFAVKHVDLRLWAWDGSTHRRKQWRRPWQDHLPYIGKLNLRTRGVPRVLQAKTRIKTILNFKCESTCHL